jgi:large subunit ribosomal protein L13
MSTNVVKAKDIKRAWHLVDAEGKILGRLSTEVAGMLSGKTKPEYVPYLDLGDYVVVVNAAKVKVTGKKEQTKEYIRHSGYPGGLKVETFEKLIKRRPEKIIEHSVRGMLPKTRLGEKMFKKLKVFSGSEHPYGKQIGGQS